MSESDRISLEYSCKDIGQMTVKELCKALYDTNEALGKAANLAKELAEDLKTQEVLTHQEVIITLQNLAKGLALTMIAVTNINKVVADHLEKVT
jgi:hypothetical protein